jgi:hypothetical protein
METLDIAIAGIFGRYINRIQKSEKGLISFEPGAWDELTQELLLLKFPPVEQQNLERRSAIERSESPLVDINEDHASKIFLDLYHIEINSFYPTIIKKFIRQGIMASTPHAKIMSYLIDFRKHLKKIEYEGAAERGTSTVCKLWINYFYGKMPSLGIDSSLISGESRRIMGNIRSMISKSWVYIDTDEVIFKGTADQIRNIKSYLHDIGISCEESRIEWGIFFAKKKYLYVKDGVLVTRGFKYSE